ncbi:MAG: hypothetical protein ABJA49_09165 [Betaproteobacteria bacterium]
MIRLPIEGAIVSAGIAPQAASGAATPATNRRSNASAFGDSVQTRVGNDGSPSSFLPDRLMDYALHMSTQMRREFGRAMDVTRFMHDGSYATEIITRAMTSKDARLRAYATFLNMQMFGARQSARASSPRGPVESAFPALASGHST